MDAKNFFYDKQHAQNYLTGGVLLHKQEPVYIQAVEGDKFPWTVYLQRLKNGSEYRASITELDLKAPLLGMANITNESIGLIFPVYYSRLPIRQWKIGHSRNNTHLKMLLRTEQTAMEIAQPYMSFPGKALYSSIVGKYPSLEDALRKFSDYNAIGVAFDRHWAVDRQKRLYYKSIGRVGYIKKTSPIFVGNYKYLEKVFERAANRK